MKKITFKYYTKTDSDWQELKLGLHDYFDLEDGEEPQLDSVSKYWLLHEYLPVSTDLLLFIHVIIEIDSDKREFKQTFWNDGKNSVVERIDTGSQPDRELINFDQIEKFRYLYGRTGVYLERRKNLPGTNNRS